MYEVVAIYSKLENRPDKFIESCKTLEEADIIASCTSCNAHVQSVNVFRVWADSIMTHRGHVATYRCGYKV